MRSYFYVLGLEPNFSVAEDSVAQELKNDAFDRVAESELNAEDEVYLRLVEMLGKKSEQTSFKQTVFRLYDFFVCRPDFDGWFEEKRKYYFAEGEDNPFLSALGDELKKGAFAFESAAETLARYIEDTLTMAEAARWTNFTMSASARRTTTT